MKRKNTLQLLLLLSFSALLIVSAYMVYGIVSQTQREQSKFKQLAKTVKCPSTVSDSLQVQESSEGESDVVVSPYKILKEKNSDLNCTPFVRQYDILSKKWGVLLCQKE